MPAAVLIDVRLVATSVVRATFDRAPRAFDPTAIHDALNPHNWTIAKLSLGYAPPVIRGEPVAGLATAIDLHLLTDLDADVDYDVRAAPAIEASP